MRTQRHLAVLALAAAVTLSATGCGLVDYLADAYEEYAGVFVDPYVAAHDQVADPANRVIVAEVVSDDLGWVAIFEDDDVNPGRVLGYAPVLFGTSYDVVVDLDRDVREGERLYAKLLRDYGVLGQFEFPGADLLVYDDWGYVVMDTFWVTLLPPVDDKPEPTS